MPYDAIVIGAGLGGLTAGAMLAKRGKKILLIEQHRIPGGCATTFRRKDLRIEVGLHAMDGMDGDDDPKMAIFKELGILDKITLIRLPEFYRYRKGEMDIVIPDNKEAAIRTLKARFPDDSRGIDRFFKVIHGISRDIRRLPRQRWRLLLQLPLFPVLYWHLLRYSPMTVGRFVDTLTDNEELKILLLANAGYYDDDPYRLGMLYFSVAQDGYLAAGGYFIKGGSQNLSNALAACIRENGGELVFGHEVTRILVRDGSAIGVRYRRAGTQQSAPQESREAMAQVIVCNAAVPNVVNTLIPNFPDQAVKKRINAMRTPSSLSTIYLGFNKPPSELGNRHYSTFVFDEGLTRAAQLAGGERGRDYRQRAFAFVDYGQIDSGLAPTGKSVGAICFADYIEEWDRLPEEEYRAKKERVTRIFLERLERLIPGISAHIEYCELGTPKTVERYTKNPGGVVYGFAQSPEQSGMKRFTGLKAVTNLYFASAWGFPGGGFTGAILGGAMTAEAIAQRG